jgi:hypothetical protein
LLQQNAVVLLNPSNHCFECWVLSSVTLWHESVAPTFHRLSQYCEENPNLLSHSMTKGVEKFLLMKLYRSSFLCISHKSALPQFTILNSLMPELNPSAQRCLTRFLTGDIAS